MKRVSYIIVLAIVSFFAIVCTSLTILAESKMVERFIFSFVEPIGVQEFSNERTEVSFYIRSFLRDGSDLPRSFFTERERSHMEDVRVLLSLAKTASVWLVFTTLLLWMWMPRHYWRRASMLTGWLLIFMVGSFLILFSMSFSSLFVRFHELVFTNDLWLLDPTRHALIRTYPPDFFQSIVTILALSLMVCGFVLVAIGKRGNTHVTQNKPDDILSA